MIFICQTDSAAGLEEIFKSRAECTGCLKSFEYRSIEKNTRADVVTGDYRISFSLPVVIWPTFE